MDATHVMIEETQAQMRRYVPGVVSRLALTYGGLLLLVTLVGALLANALAQIIPATTAAIIAFGINLWILIDLRARIEQRLHGTALFVLYVRASRARRDFEKALADDATLSHDRQALREHYQIQATAFTAAAQDAGVQPVRQKTE